MNLLRVSQYFKRFIYVYLTAIPGGYERKKLEILRYMVVESAKFMNAIEAPYWLDFGTLLGFQREKDVIAHDIDVDYGMLAVDYEKVLKHKHLLPPSFSFYDTSSKHFGSKLYMNYKGFDIDIYFYEEEGEKLRSTERAHFENERQWIPKSLVFPLSEADFFEEKVKVPFDTVPYLKKIYGYIGANGKRNMTTGFWHENETL